DLTHACPDPVPASPGAAQLPRGDETVSAAVAADTGELSDSADVLDDTHDMTTITHRRNQTPFLVPGGQNDVAVPRLGQAAAKLCRLAFELASEPDISSVAHLALNGLFESTHVDAGAMLLLPRDGNGEFTPTDLQIVASRTDLEPTYHRPSSFLASTALRDGEAVLARNIEGDSQLATKDSKDEFHAIGAICAPIRQDRKLLGLIHPYPTNPEP